MGLDYNRASQAEQFMPNYICITCGIQFATSDAPPAACPICIDYRQFVNWEGQQWITLDELRRNHCNILKPEGPSLTGIGTEPRFAIGQRALLLQKPGGNVLWDCLSLLDAATVASVRDLGGLCAIAISHPHYYSSLVEWSRAFGDVPVYLHSADRRWAMRPDPCIVFWEGETLDIGEGLTLIRCGIHFEGGSVLHWPEGASGRGALLTGDIFQVVMDRRHVSFMRSYPNFIPERPSVIRRALEAVEPFRFDAIYGAWWRQNIRSDAKAAVVRSAERYLNLVEDRPSNDGAFG